MIPLPTFFPSCCSYNCLDSLVPNLMLNFNLTARVCDSTLLHGQERVCCGIVIRSDPRLLVSLVKDVCFVHDARENVVSIAARVGLGTSQQSPNSECL